MKKSTIAILFILALFSALLLGACSGGEIIYSQEEPLMLESVEELNELLSKGEDDRIKGVEYYYMPVKTLGDSKEYDIMARESYISFLYELPDSMKNQATYASDTANYTWHRVTDADNALKISVKSGNYKEIIRDGQKYYYICHEGVEYTIDYVYDGGYISVLLPAVYPIDELIDYAQVRKVTP